MPPKGTDGKWEASTRFQSMLKMVEGFPEVSAGVGVLAAMTVAVLGFLGAHIPMLPDMRTNKNPNNKNNISLRRNAILIICPRCALKSDDYVSIQITEEAEPEHLVRRTGLVLLEGTGLWGRNQCVVGRGNNGDIR